MVICLIPISCWASAGAKLSRKTFCISCRVGSWGWKGRCRKKRLRGLSENSAGPIFGVGGLESSTAVAAFIKSGANWLARCPRAWSLSKKKFSEFLKVFT